MKLQTQKLITCIFPKGVAVGVAARLKAEFDLMSVDIKSARGIGKITPLAFRGAGEQAEKEILMAVVPEEQADEIFEFIYEIAEVNRPHGGLMYVYPLYRATKYELPALPAES